MNEQFFSPVSEFSAQDSAPSLRWLHLSDFHVGKDNYGQRRLFKYILREVERQVASGDSPDLVFITGDVADKGQSAQYTEFNDYFLSPLTDLVGKNCARFIMVPGNHDVDRAQAQAVQTYDILYKVPRFLDPTEEGLLQRKYLFDRFTAFANNETAKLNNQWLFSPQGALIQSLEIRGHKIGILGLNTAWLSRSDDDRHQLSAGKAIIETGLEALGDCHVRIVLGHHPIDWFIDEDVEPIRALFSKYNVIYLHGHLHKPVSRYEGGGGYHFLALQSGVCFETRDDEIWVSRMLWGALNLRTRQVLLKPLRWSGDNHEWSIDGAAFPERYRQPGSDYWVLPLPTPPAGVQPLLEATQSQQTLTTELPLGWQLIDKSFLEEHRTTLDSEQALRYFDGRWPRWREALSPQIPKRAVVKKLVKELEDVRQDGRLQVTRISGATGEGKTTALMQIVSELVELEDSKWRVIWHDITDSPLPATLLKQLPEWEGTWLIASDDANLIAKSVFNSVQALREKGRYDVQFLLCSREADWVDAGADTFKWYKYATLLEEPLRGISLPDAEDIVRAWSAYGSQGLGKLKGLNIDDAAARLVRASEEEANKNEGAFLGGMLRVRIGAGLKVHVRALLDRLKSRQIPGGNLLDAFAYIAAAHAENIRSLSKVVLAEALGCTTTEVTSEVLYPLAEETAVTIVGQYILTRHKAIADVTVELLANTFRFDMDDIYANLVWAARQVRTSGGFVPQLGDWDYLSSHFFDKGNEALGIRLAKVAVETGETKEHLVVKYAQLLREAGQADQSVQVFLGAPSYVGWDRNFYNEWAASERVLGNQALGIWLHGIALADRTTMRLIDINNAKVGLTGLGYNFLELFDKYDRALFIEASDAALQLITRLKLNNKDFSSLAPLKAKRQNQKPKSLEVNPATAFRRLQDGIIAAWEQREGELPLSIKPATNLNFTDLARLLGVTVQVTSDY